MPFLRFGSCEIHLLRREVWLGGQRQPLAPKAYALLLLLIEQRHRVVTKDELLQAVWRRGELSPSVLGRTVMLARRAIGDVAAQPRWIQSLHGVGYRFIGDVHEIGTPFAEPAEPAAPAGAGVAVLPCENATGDATLEWVHVGLMALASRALAAGGPWQAVAPAALLKWLATAAPDALPEEQARGAIAALGLAGAVHARLVRQGLALWLEYRLYRAHGPTVTGSLRGDDAVLLAERLAGEVARALGAPAPGPVWRDTFVAQAYARAAESAAQGLHQAALQLIEVVAQAGPLPEEAALLQLQCLKATDRNAAEASARGLLARVAGDRRLEGRIHALLADGPGAAAREHREAALRCAEGLAGEDWALQLQLDAAAAAHAGGNAGGASRLARRVLEQAGHPVLRAQAQLRLAAIDLAAGELADAECRSEAAFTALRALHRLPEQASALAGLAAVQAAAGRFDAACARVDELLQRQREGATAPPGTLGRVAAVLVQRADAPRLRQALDALGNAGQAEREAARAALALALGNGAQALQGLHALLERGAANEGLPFLQDWLPLLLRLAAQQGGHRALERTVAALGRCLPLHEDAVLRAAVVRAQAAAQWQAGAERAARRTLGQLVQLLPAGSGQALARIDLAWLTLDRGDPHGADVLLSGLGPWLREHPAGLAVRARRLHAEGQRAEAIGTQAQALLRYGGAVPALQRSLQRTYADAAGAPRLPTLASDAWWLPPAALPARQPVR